MSRNRKQTPAKPVARMSHDEIAEAARAWDEAQAELKKVGELAEAAQKALDQLPADADVEARQAALDTVDAAEQAVTAAEAVIADLTPPAPEQVQTAKSEETPPEPEPDPAPAEPTLKIRLATNLRWNSRTYAVGAMLDMPELVARPLLTDGSATRIEDVRI